MFKSVLKSESLASLIALVVVAIVFTAINGRFLSRLNIEGIIVSASISAIVSLGMTFVIAMRALDLSVGSIMGFVAVIAATMLSHDVSLSIVIAISLLAAAGLGLRTSGGSGAGGICRDARQLFGHFGAEPDYHAWRNRHGP